VAAFIAVQAQGLDEAQFPNDVPPEIGQKYA
jgi:hypothetical protein